jgi:hypothetical protein
MARSISKAKTAKMSKSHKKRHTKSHKKSLKHRKGHKTAKKQRKGKRKSKNKKAGGPMSWSMGNKFADADMRFRKRQDKIKEQQRNEIAKRNREQMLAQKAQTQAQAQSEASEQPGLDRVHASTTDEELDMI